MQILNKNHYTKATGVAVAIGAASTTGASDFGDAYSETVDVSRDVRIQKSGATTGGTLCRLKVSVPWDEQAKKRFDELLLRKSQKRTSPEEDEEFAELYEARSEYYDQSTSDQAVAEFRRKRAFNELIEAFDKYVIAEKISH